MFLKKLLVALPLAFIFSGSAFAASTSIEIENQTSSSETLINTSYTGTFSPAPSDPLAANSTTYHVSSTSGTIDAGLVRYGSCVFNWSVMKLGTYYTFSKGADPASDCTAQVLSQNFVTGEYSLKFEIND